MQQYGFRKKYHFIDLRACQYSLLMEKFQYAIIQLGFGAPLNGIGVHGVCGH